MVAGGVVQIKSCISGEECHLYPFAGGYQVNSAPAEVTPAPTSASASNFSTEMNAAQALNKTVEKKKPIARAAEILPPYLRFA